MKSSQPFTLLVLAAGMGSRYGGLKQIDPVGPGGETIMDYSIYDAMRAGCRKLVFVIRRDIEVPFKEAIGARFETRLPVEYAFQELDDLPAGFKCPAQRTKPWGTGQAILSAAKAIREPFAAINADDFYGMTSFRALAEHLQSGCDEYAMVGFVLHNTLSEFGSVARGICRSDAAGFLEVVTELTRIEKRNGGIVHTNGDGLTCAMRGDETVSMNMWGFTPALFPQLQNQFTGFLQTNGQNEKAEFFIPAVVNDLIRTGQSKCRVLRTADSWFGVTYREDRPRVTAGIRTLVARGDYPERLWA